MFRVDLIPVLPDLARVLVIQTSDGWRLPDLDDSFRETLTTELPRRLADWITEPQVIHWAPLECDPPRTYCLVLARGEMRSTDVSAVPISTLLDTSAAIRGQKQALLTCASRLHAPVAPFDAPGQVAAALAWMEREITRTVGGHVLSHTAHGCRRHDYVLHVHSTHGDFYFKGGVDRVEDEAALTVLLRALSPRAVPDTLSIDRVHHRWLYRAMPGATLTGPLLTLQTAAAAARALASLQKRAATSSAIAAHLRTRHMTATELLRRTDQEIRRSWGSVPSATEHGYLLPAWQILNGPIVDTCARMDALGLPLSLVLSDFWSRNILMTPEGIGFLDVGNSYWSYPFLPLWRLIRDVGRRLDYDSARRAIERAFAEEWSDVIPTDQMSQALGHLAILGQLFGILMAACDLDRYEREIGHALPIAARCARLAPRIRAVLNTANRHDALRRIGDAGRAIAS